jgi:hypothetical protein
MSLEKEIIENIDVNKSDTMACAEVLDILRKLDIRITELEAEISALKSQKM